MALPHSVMTRKDAIGDRLIRPFLELSVAATLAYYIVYRPGYGSFPKVIALRQ